MKQRTVSLAGALVWLAAAIPLQAQDAEIGIARGAVPTAVTIEDLDGNPVDLGRWIGKTPVVIEFWATWCPLCEKLFSRMATAHARYGDSVAFVVVAVAVNQSQRSIRRHLERHPMPFTVLWDTRGRAVRAFETPTTSYVVVLDGAGRVVYTGTGEDQDIEGAVGTAVSGER